MFRSKEKNALQFKKTSVPSFPKQFLSKNAFQFRNVSVLWLKIQFQGNVIHNVKTLIYKYYFSGKSVFLLRDNSVRRSPKRSVSMSRFKFVIR